MHMAFKAGFVLNQSICSAKQKTGSSAGFAIGSSMTSSPSRADLATNFSHCVIAAKNTSSIFRHILLIPDNTSPTSLQRLVIQRFSLNPE